MIARTSTVATENVTPAALRRYLVAMGWRPNNFVQQPQVDLDLRPRGRC